MQDPLNISIAGKGVDTAFPLLPEADYEFQITESAPVPNKRQDGYNWRLKLNLTQPAQSVPDAQGVARPIAVNTTVFHLVAMQPGPEATDAEGFKKSLFATVDAIYGTNADNRPDFNKETWDGAIGKRVKAHIVIDEYQGQKSNKVKRLKAL